MSAYDLVGATPAEWAAAGVFWLSEMVGQDGQADVDYANMCWTMAVSCFNVAWRRGWPQ